MNTIRLPNTPENRYLKEVFDHLLANHRDSQFGYDDIPGPDRGTKSSILVVMKSYGLRDSVAMGRFALTNEAKNSQIVLG